MYQALTDYRALGAGPATGRAGPAACGKRARAGPRLAPAAQRQAARLRAMPDRDSVELLVATYDDVYTIDGSERMTAAPPRQPGAASPPHGYPEGVSGPPTNGQRVDPAEILAQRQSEGRMMAAQEQFASQLNSNKAMKAELTIATAELKQKTLELAELQMVVGSREREIQELRTELVDRDSWADGVRADLEESRRAIAQKDALLESSYNALTTACKERSELRRQLVQVQSELFEAREALSTALLRWGEDIETLQNAAFMDFDELQASLEERSARHDTYDYSPSNTFWPCSSTVRRDWGDEENPLWGRDAGADAAMAALQATEGFVGADEDDEGMVEMLRQLADYSRLVVEEAQIDDGQPEQYGHNGNGNGSGYWG